MLAALSALALLAAVNPGIEVRASGDRLDVRASVAPLADVLDRLSRETGMKVVYEGPPPRQLVSATLVDRTPAEAVLGILEGLGLNYAVALDASGTRVQTLLMAGSAPSGPAAPTPAAPARFAPPTPRVPPEVTPPEEETPEQEQEAEQPEEGAAPDQAGTPAGAPGEKPEAEPQAAAPSGPTGPAPVVVKPGFDPFGGSTFTPPTSPYGTVMQPPQPKPEATPTPAPQPNKPQQ